MQRRKATELRQQWGGKPCEHPSFSREYDLGERTGNYCCTQCGATVTFREKVEITKGREGTDGGGTDRAGKERGGSRKSR